MVHRLQCVNKVVMVKGTSMGKKKARVFPFDLQLLATSSILLSQLNFHALIVNYINVIVQIPSDCFSEKSSLDFYFKIGIIFILHLSPT